MGNPSNDMSGGATSGVDEDEESISAFMKKMTKQMAAMNENLTGMQNNIKLTVAEAIEPLQMKLDNNSRRIDRIESMQATELAKLRSEMSGQIRDATPGLEQGGHGPGGRALLTAAPTYASATLKNTKERSTSRLAAPVPDENAWYWEARKKLRFFPIEGTNDEQIKANLESFVAEKLRIPQGVLRPEDVQFVRRVRSSKRSKIQDEIMVSYTNVAARDLVQSYARNLGEWVGEGNKPLAGLRMEIPERLLGDFKALELYHEEQARP